MHRRLAKKAPDAKYRVKLSRTQDGTGTEATEGVKFISPISGGFQTAALSKSCEIFAKSAEGESGLFGCIGRRGLSVLSAQRMEGKLLNEVQQSKEFDVFLEWTMSFMR